MAIWQFSVDFIPRRTLIKRFNEIPKKIGDQILWEEDLTEGIILPVNFEKLLDSLGEKETLEWGVNQLNWGDYDNGTHITIIAQYDDKVSIFARFHIGEYNESFVKNILEFAKLCDCLLLTNNTVIEPELEDFVKELEQSNSYKFCNDPIGYLQSDEVKKLNWEIKKKISE